MPDDHDGSERSPLDRSARRAVRLLLLSTLERARAAAGAMEEQPAEGSSAAAGTVAGGPVFELRDALLDLRATAGVFAPWLDDGRRGHALRRIRALGRLARLDPAAARDSLGLWGDRLREAIAHYRVDVRDEEAMTARSVAWAVHRVLPERVAELREALEAREPDGSAIGAGGGTSPASLVASRARRVRCLLAPLGGEVTGAPGIVDRLRTLESGEGGPTDSDQVDGLLSDLEALRGRLLERAPDSVEIERKYLLSGLPPHVEGRAFRELEQGYLPGTVFHERLRRIHEEGREDRFVRTVKSGAGVQRIELQEEIDEELFDALWPLTEGRRLTKRRWRVRDGGLVWEVDAFTDRSLHLAEVELPSPELRPEPPEWLRPHVVRDVTDEAEYLNVNLAR